jgi:hypothetical protein
MLEILAVLSAAILLGGMVFFSFGFAPVLFAQLPSQQVRPLLRGTFPHYYMVVFALACLTAIAALPVSHEAAIPAGIIALSTVYARQILMHQINAATDRGDKRAFAMLHGLSVVIQLVQIGLTVWVLLALIHRA